MREQFLLNSQLRISDLQTLLSLRDHGSVRAVARLFGTTPGAVSKALKRLEAAIGHALCERTPGAIRLTLEGEKLAMRVGPLLQTLRPEREDRGIPRLAVTAPSFLTELLVDSLMPLANIVQWQCFEMSPSLMASNLHGRLFAMALTNDARELSMPWTTTRVAELPVELYANPSMAQQFRKKQVEPEDLMALDFITPIYKVGDRLVSGEDGCPIPVQQRRVALEVQTVHAGLLAATRLDALIYSPRVAARHLVAAGKLEHIKVRGWQTEQAIHLWTHADLVDASIQKRLLQRMRATIAE